MARSGSLIGTKAEREGTARFSARMMAAYKRGIEAAPNPAARLKEIGAMLNELGSLFRTAEAVGIEEIMVPRETRPLLCDWGQQAYERLPLEVGRKQSGIRP